MTSRIAAAMGLVALALVVGALVVSSSDDDPVPTAAEAGASADIDGGSEPSGGDTEPSSTTEPSPALPDDGLHPELVEIAGWLQSDVTSLEELRGQVVAVQFWTFGCSNCQATLPHMQELYATYHDQGFEIVGIHAPEFEYEADVDNIVDAAVDLGVSWPIALDPTKRTFHSWQEGPTAHWPRVYLLDRAGHVRYDHIGEGGYDTTDAAVQALLAEPE